MQEHKISASTEKTKSNTYGEEFKKCLYEGFVKAINAPTNNKAKIEEVGKTKNLLQYEHDSIDVLHTIESFIHTDARDGGTRHRPLTERGNALRIIDKAEGLIYFIYETKEWIVWDDTSWKPDIGGAGIKSFAGGLSSIIYYECGSYHKDSIYYNKWARDSQSKKVIENTVAILSNQPRVRLSLNKLNSQQFIVGLDHGKQVIDLRNGIVRAAAKEDFVTKSLMVDYLGDAHKATKWLQFLDRIFAGDKELINWLQRWCGYLLTGSTKEQIFVFCHGHGANGKSVMAETLSYILGDYGRAISSTSLSELKRQGGAASPDLASLIGARLAITSETEDDVALAESLVKSLVAGDTISVRKLYSEPVQFKPQFKLMMLGNHKPVIKGTDHGIWRRIRLIPFNVTIPAEERDPDLLDKLKQEAPHILAWMVEGCLMWGEQGLGDLPESVAHAIGDYRQDQNILGRWIEECFDATVHAESISSDFYRSYIAWCETNGLKPISNVALGRKLPEHGFTGRKSGGKNYWYGPKLTR